MADIGMFAGALIGPLPTHTIMGLCTIFSITQQSFYCQIYTSTVIAIHNPSLPVL
ncbi:hypothetical protein AjGTCBM29_00449 [Aeromonas jandaei]|nr:hypothetical protein AjGTCBM29_00449 [Aeromonas jandaei]